MPNRQSKNYSTWCVWCAKHHLHLLPLQAPPLHPHPHLVLHDKRAPKQRLQNANGPSCLMGLMLSLDRHGGGGGDDCSQNPPKKKVKTVQSSAQHTGRNGEYQSQWEQCSMCRGVELNDRGTHNKNYSALLMQKKTWKMVLSLSLCLSIYVCRYVCKIC